MMKQLTCRRTVVKVALVFGVVIRVTDLVSVRNCFIVLLSILLPMFAIKSKLQRFLMLHRPPHKVKVYVRVCLRCLLVTLLTVLHASVESSSLRVETVQEETGSSLVCLRLPSSLSEMIDPTGPQLKKLEADIAAAQNDIEEVKQEKKEAEKRRNALEKQLELAKDPEEKALIQRNLDAAETALRSSESSLQASRASLQSSKDTYKVVYEVYKTLLDDHRARFPPSVSGLC